MGGQPAGDGGDYKPLPRVRVEATEESGVMEMVTLLSTVSVPVRDASFDGGERTVTVSVPNGVVEVVLTDGTQTR